MYKSTHDQRSDLHLLVLSSINMHAYLIRTNSAIPNFRLARIILIINSDLKIRIQFQLQCIFYTVLKYIFYYSTHYVRLLNE